MSYKYIVKTYRWINGRITVVNTEFTDEQAALNHAKTTSPAETVKVYVDDGVIYTANASIELSKSYA
jgi:hypothetical protein